MHNLAHDDMKLKKYFQQRGRNINIIRSIILIDFPRVKYLCLKIKLLNMLVMCPHAV